MLQTTRFRKQTGTISIVNLLLLFAFAAPAWIALECVHLLHKNHEIQLKLDTCAAKNAELAKDAIGVIESLNQKVVYLRTALLAASAIPGVGQAVIAGIRIAIQVAASARDAAKIAYDVILNRWRTGLACVDQGISPVVAEDPGELPWTKMPPDPLGPTPLRWQPGKKPLIKFKANYISMGLLRVGAAEIIGGDNALVKDWKSQWSSLH